MSNIELGFSTIVIPRFCNPSHRQSRHRPLERLLLLAQNLLDKQFSVREYCRNNNFYFGSRAVGIRDVSAANIVGWHPIGITHICDFNLVRRGRLEIS